ncbi:hypothetical protein CFP65_2517 [Kitasatospora sp. MMS16-BH015]|uniref:hypothetical protein n=1 Tax=Kitasatospora sp. MMS16-BH015 TaxID=2018025 RepID=UPI000CA3E6CD|nr:hypothetical protein [Kitasatospora sp. MMS16-BH015]AUG77346.1 hypothetical protein CFP65_2517 [Kitasatospora sp. MMS16-BH015]
MPDRQPPLSDQGGSPAAPAVPGSGTPVRRFRPAQLLFEPQADTPEPERFFNLESIDDPAELLRRSTELTLAFRAAADRAADFQAVAAAQLADPRRFDALSPAEIADRADWTPDYAVRMVEHGRGLLKQQRNPEH